MRTWMLSLAVIAVALAGCSDAAAPAQQADEFSDELDEQLQATDSTGVIRGVVVDNAIVPVVGADIRLVGAQAKTTSNDNGQFGFGGLEPGTYFMEVSKLGFIPAQQSVEVQAGVEDPPVVRVLLQRDESFNPYSSTRQHTGYYQCGLAFVVVCGAPNLLLGEGTAPDSSTWTFYFEKAPTYWQTEMVWDSTQEVSPDLRLEVEALDSGCTGALLIENQLGPSPLKIAANETGLSSRSVGGDECGLYHSIFAGDILEQAHCDYWVVPIVKCGIGFAIEQEFEWFVSEFHGYQPPEDWWYTQDGDYDPPQ